MCLVFVNWAIVDWNDVLTSLQACLCVWWWCLCVWRGGVAAVMHRALWLGSLLSAVFVCEVRFLAANWIELLDLVGYLVDGSVVCHCHASLLPFWLTFVLLLLSCVFVFGTSVSVLLVVQFYWQPVIGHNGRWINNIRTATFIGECLQTKTSANSCSESPYGMHYYKLWPIELIVCGSLCNLICMCLSH